MSGLTDKAVKNLKPKGKDYRLRDKAGKDSGYHGFGVKVTAKGKKSFFLEYTMNSKRRFMNLGPYPAISLSKARSKAKEARERITEGIDPQEERKEREAEQEAKRKARLAKEAAEAKATTVNQLLDYYIEKQTNQGTIDNITVLVNNDVRPAIGEMRARDVTSKDVKTIILAIKNRGSNISARQTYTYLHAAFNLALKDDECPGYEEWDINPVSKVTKPEKSTPDRTALSKEDIETLWSTLESYNGMEDALKDALRILLLTGQRVQEVVGMQWSELDMEEAQWTIPPSRLKTGKKRPSAHIVPLTTMVIEIIKQQPRITDETGIPSNQVFPGRASIHEPYKWRSLGKAVGRMIEKENLPHFSPRTLRGTVKTHMARIKVLKEIRDRIQNHALTDVADVHYDAHDYLDEKRYGLMKWERELQRIIREKNNDNVVQMRA